MNNLYRSLESPGTYELQSCGPLRAARGPRGGTPSGPLSVNRLGIVRTIEQNEIVFHFYVGRASLVDAREPFFLHRQRLAREPRTSSGDRSPQPPRSGSSFTHVRRGSIYWYTGGGMINGCVERCADNIMRRIVLSTGTHDRAGRTLPGPSEPLKNFFLHSPLHGLSGNCHFLLQAHLSPTQSSLLSTRIFASHSLLRAAAITSI